MKKKKFIVQYKYIKINFTIHFISLKFNLFFNS